VRRLSGLYLLGINDRALQIHPQILKKDIIFRQESDQAREVFVKISPEESEKMRKNFIIASGGKWKPENNSSATEEQIIGRLERIRETHQNAYRKWTEKEETEVMQAFKSGKSIKNISALTGRQVGGIRSRLIKLGVIQE
jgi:DNA-directed RNA polymerase specialized sigma24 family protein